MSEHDLDPDPVVVTALRHLPIPEHEDDFWAMLSDRIDAELGVASHSGTVPGDDPTQAVAGTDSSATEPDPALALVPASLRHKSNVALSLAAAAAAVMVVVAAASLVSQRSDGNTTTTESATAADGSDDGTTPDDPTAGTPIATLSAPGDDPATAAVVSWINALAEGDMTAAWTALGPTSQQHWGTQDRFAGERSSLAEGYGAWSRVQPDAIIVTPLASPGGADLVVVTLVGTVEQEGGRHTRADAFPVRLFAGKASLELYADAGEPEVVIPGEAPDDGSWPVISRDDDLVVVVPLGVGAPTIRLDDGEALVCGKAKGTELTELEGPSGQRCSYRPEAGMSPGRRVLTVAFGAPDGSSVAAHSVLFEVA